MKKLEYFVETTVVGKVVEGTFKWEDAWKLKAYTTTGVNFPVESRNVFGSKAEAEAACVRVNAGDETGMSFGSFSDD